MLKILFNLSHILIGDSEMQSELPLWSSGLKNLGYSAQFPTFPRTTSTSPAEIIEEDQDTPAQPRSEMSDTDEEKGWRFYIGSICNRRTVNDMLIDLWRCGEQDWVNNISGTVDRTTEAVNVLCSW